MICGSIGALYQDSSREPSLADTFYIPIRERGDTALLLTFPPPAEDHI